jgi:basic membrane protein A
MKFGVLKFTALLLLGSCAAGYNEGLAQMKVVQVTEAGGVSDRSFNQDIYEGIERFFARYPEAGIYSYVIAETPDSLSVTVKAVADSGADIIITGGFNFEAVIAEAAGLYPDITFILVDGYVEAENVRSLKYNEYEAGRLAGVAAGRQALADGVGHPLFGIIEGMEVPAVVNYRNGFAEGVKSAVPDAAFENLVLNSWTDTGKAKSFSMLLRDKYGSRLYALMTLAGTANGGAIGYAAELYNKGERLYIIGCDTDMYEMGRVGADDSVVLTSALKLCGNDVEEALEELKKGTFKAGLYEGKVGYAITHNALVHH